MENSASAGLLQFSCPQCLTELKAVATLAGSQCRCPCCQLIFEIPQKNYAVLSVATYALRQSEEATAPLAKGHVRIGARPPKITAQTGPPNIEVDTSESGQSAEPFDRRPILPKHPIINGVFRFPFSSGTRTYTLVTAIWAMMTFMLARESYLLGTSAEPRTWILSAVLGAIVATLLTAWFVHTAACALAIVRDTGNGCDRIQDWPKHAFVDWFIDGLYLFNSLCVSLLPGIVLNWFLTQCGLTTNTILPFMMPACLFLFFPIVLLSLLEKGSLFGIISPPVYQTLWVAWRGWLAFYGISFVLLVAVVAAMASMVFVHQFWIVAVPILTLVLTGFVYFRSLGRLAWYSAERTADTAEEPEDFS